MIDLQYSEYFVWQYRNKKTKNTFYVQPFLIKLYHIMK